MKFDSLINDRVATALLVLVIFLVMTLLALGFPEKARLMPLLIGIPASLLALIQLVNEIRHSREESATNVLGLTAAERMMFSWTFLFFFGILGFGFLYGAPALVFGFLLVGKKETLTVAAISATATWAVLYGVFELSFKIPVFAGLIVEWLTG